MQKVARWCRSQAALALAVTGWASAFVYGDPHAVELDRRIVAFVGTVAFVGFAVPALHGFARRTRVRAAARIGVSRAASIVLIGRVLGYGMILVAALGLLGVPIGRLLLGGAVTGIIIGVAAQQSLANFFAGIMLMFSRPFAVGDRVAVHSGGMGGTFTGVVAEMGLTYVRLDGPEGPVLLPNATVLTAAIIPNPAPEAGPEPTGGSGVAPTTAAARDTRSADAAATV